MRLGLGTDISVGYRQPLFGGVPLLLDTYTGAAAAYSLRQLRTGVTNVVRVREDSANTEEDFTAEEITDGTLLAFVGAGNNGHVVTWYDQSGNGNDATQSTAANQPKIVSAGSLLTSSTIPFINDGSTWGYLTASLTGSASATIFAVAAPNPIRVANLLLQGDFSSEWILVQDDGSNDIVDSLAGTVNYYKNGAIWTPANRNAVHDDLADTFTLITIFPDTSGWTELNIGYKSAGNFSMFDSMEYIVYNSDQSANRTAIEQNINDHYSIYP